MRPINSSAFSVLWLGDTAVNSITPETCARLNCLLTRQFSALEHYREKKKQKKKQSERRDGGPSVNYTSKDGFHWSSYCDIYIILYWKGSSPPLTWWTCWTWCDVCLRNTAFGAFETCRSTPKIMSIGKKSCDQISSGSWVAAATCARWNLGIRPLQEIESMAYPPTESMQWSKLRSVQGVEECTIVDQT